MRLYAQLCKYFGWSHHDIDSLDYLTFFGYVREASVLIEEEKEATNSGTQGIETQPARQYY